MKLQFVEAGEIVTTHGVRGDMKVLPWGDSPEFLCEFSRVRIGGADYEVESCRIQKTCNLLKVRGIDSMETAQAMRGKTVEVFAEGQKIGKIREVLDYPGNSVYVVKGEHEYMIPAVKQFILSTDLEQNVMQVAIIEGMRSDEN